MELYRKNGVNPLGGCLPVRGADAGVVGALHACSRRRSSSTTRRFCGSPTSRRPIPYFVLPLCIGGAELRSAKAHAAAGRPRNSSK